MPKQIYAQTKSTNINLIHNSCRDSFQMLVSEVTSYMT